MSTLAKNIVYGQGFKAHSQKLIRNSVFEEIATISRTKNPMCNIFSKDFRHGESHALDTDTSGNTLNAETYTLNTQTTANKLYKHNGLTFFTREAITVADEPAFIQALQSGAITPYTTAYAGENEINLENHKVDFWLNTLRGEAKLRALGADISIEALQDLAALSNDPSSLIAAAIIAPAITDINREVCYRLMQLAQKEMGYVLDRNYLAARNLILAIEVHSQKIFKDTGVKGNVVVCDSETLAILISSGWLEQDVDMTEEEIPNRYYSKSGITFMAQDFYEGFNYMIILANHQDGEIIQCPVHLHFYQPSGEDIQVTEALDVKSMQPTFRSSARYTVLCAPFNNISDEKIVVADTDECFAKFAGKHPMVHMMGIQINPHAIAKVK
ncbi:TPA: hypothetical protein ACMDXI_001012 [Vibrio parahaemolyticus]